MIFTTVLNRKFSAKFTNRTGFSFTKMYYDMEMNLAPHMMQGLELISKGDGNTNLIAGYTSSSIGLSNRVTLTAGINAQLLTLNNSWTIEDVYKRQVVYLVKWESASFHQ